VDKNEDNLLKHVLQVLNVFLNMFPIALHFIPYPLASSFTRGTNITHPKGGDCNIFSFGKPKLA
jgi:hypothetical protein